MFTINYFIYYIINTIRIFFKYYNSGRRISDLDVSVNVISYRTIIMLYRLFHIYFYGYTKQLIMSCFIYNNLNIKVNVLVVLFLLEHFKNKLSLKNLNCNLNLKNNKSVFFNDNFIYGAGCSTTNIYKINFKHNIGQYNTNHLIQYSATTIVKFLISSLTQSIMYLRKAKIFNKGRYSRNRQFYRTGVYWCLFINLIAVIGLYFWFYRFTMNFGYIWWLLYCNIIILVLAKLLNFRLFYINTFLDVVKDEFRFLTLPLLICYKYFLKFSTTINMYPNLSYIYLWRFSNKGYYTNRQKYTSDYIGLILRRNLYLKNFISIVKK